MSHDEECLRIWNLKPSEVGGCQNKYLASYEDNAMPSITWEDFQKIELRAGTIIKVENFPEAKKPAYKVWVSLGELGVKKSSAQITGLYRKDELIGRQVLCVVNFKPKQIANFLSEILITGFVVNDKDVILAVPERRVADGTRLS